MFSPGLTHFIFFVDKIFYLIALSIRERIYINRYKYDTKDCITKSWKNGLPWKFFFSPIKICFLSYEYDNP
jgi:hypothetical protein